MKIIVGACLAALWVALAIVTLWALALTWRGDWM